MSRRNGERPAPWPPLELTDLQLDLLEALWSLEPATVVEVQEHMTERGLARTTVATLLSRLEAQGHVEREMRGRVGYYRARTRPEETRRSALRGVVERLFGGDRVAVVSRLFGDDPPGPEEVEALRRLLESRGSEP